MLSINIDFELAYRQADEMSRCADELFIQHKNLEMSIAELCSIWTGGVSATFVEKLEASASLLYADAVKCRDEAAAFRMKVDEIKLAEESATHAMSCSAEAS